MTMMQTIPRSMRRDPIMPGKRLRCRINVRSATAPVPGNDAPASHGVSEVVIHENDLDRLKAMVETTPDAWQTALAIVARKTAEHVAEASRRPIADVLAIAPEEWPEDWTTLAEGYAGTTAGAEFRNLTGHDHTALLSVDVIEELPGEVGREMALAHQVAQGIRATNEPGGEVAELRAQVAELKALIEGQAKPKPTRGR